MSRKGKKRNRDCIMVSDTEYDEPMYEFQINGRLHREDFKVIEHGLCDRIKSKQTLGMEKVMMLFSMIAKKENFAQSEKVGIVWLDRVGKKKYETKGNYAK